LSRWSKQSRTSRRLSEKEKTRLDVLDCFDHQGCPLSNTGQLSLIKEWCWSLVSVRMYAGL
jgi:hypothetical protein